jgi:isopentenyl diphosphate isomerase/L-lactate dehydrogenase-like FMN-dependent dehydrogenase
VHTLAHTHTHTQALALGAKAVFVGRPILWGLSVGGEDGVRRTLEVLNEELVTVMQLNGCSTTDQITRAHVRDTKALPGL